MAVVFMYAVLGGMKGITYTQVAQYCVLIFAYLVPAIFISLLITDIPVPQLGLGSDVVDGSGLSVLDKLDNTLVDLGFGPYTRRQQIHHRRVRHHPGADGGHGRPAPRHRALLHRAQGVRRAPLCRLCAAVHRPALYHRPGRRRVRPTQFRRDRARQTRYSEIDPAGSATGKTSA